MKSKFNKVAAFVFLEKTLKRIFQVLKRPLNMKTK